MDWINRLVKNPLHQQQQQQQHDPWAHPAWTQMSTWWMHTVQPHLNTVHQHPLLDPVRPHLRPLWDWLLAYLDHWQSGQYALLERLFYLWMLCMVHWFAWQLLVETAGWAVRVVRGDCGGPRVWWEGVKRVVFVAVRRVPGMQRVVDREIAKVTGDIAGKLLVEKRPRQLRLPVNGMSEEQVRQHWQKYKQLDHVDWQKGRVSGTVYHGGQQFSKLLSEAYAAFSHSNPLHPDVFPSVRQMEADIVQMCLGMYHGGEQACGSVTSGGTESILMACKAYRDRGYALKSITEPEMVVPVSAHAAFDKAAGYFGIKLVHVPIDPHTLKVDLRRVKRAINSNTVMLVGSAPGYPHGIIDDIEALGRLAKKHDIGLHVDCCLGSFIVPFLEKAGFECPPFDFSVDGVTSISCDTHKFGFAPKGSSVVMYSDYKIRHYQYFVAPNWLGGIYASPSIAGSRPGALIAACWTSLMHTGEKGYVESTKAIVNAARKIRQGIEQIEDVELCGDPLAMVVAWSSKKLNIYAIGDAMTARGWNLNTLQHPSAIHICCTLPTVPVVDDFLADLRAAVAEVRANPSGQDKDGMGAIYGMAASIPDKSLVVDIARGYLDVLTRP